MMTCKHGVRWYRLCVECNPLDPQTLIDRHFYELLGFHVQPCEFVFWRNYHDQTRNLRELEGK